MSRQDVPVAHGFLSYKDMEERVRDLDKEKHRGADLGDGLGPRRPLEDPDGSIDEVDRSKRGGGETVSLRCRW